MASDRANHVALTLRDPATSLARVDRAARTLGRFGGGTLLLPASTSGQHSEVISLTFDEIAPKSGVGEDNFDA